MTAGTTQLDEFGILLARHAVPLSVGLFESIQSPSAAFVGSDLARYQVLLMAEPDPSGIAAKKRGKITVLILAERHDLRANAWNCSHCGGQLSMALGALLL